MKKLLSTRYTYCKDYLEKIIINENDSEHYYKMIKDIYWSDERFRK